MIDNTTKEDDVKPQDYNIWDMWEKRFDEVEKRIAALESPTPAEPQAISDEEVAKLPDGVYLLSGGFAHKELAAVGTEAGGDKWYVFLCGYGYKSTDWSTIDRIERMSVE